MLQKAIRTLLHEYGWIHLSAGLAGKIAFLIGSLLFLQGDGLREAGIWCYISGSGLMAVDAVGQLLLEIFNRR